MHEYGISVSDMYSALYDADLDTVVRNIKSRFPHAGYRTVKGCLQAEGHRVQWTRVKASVHRVDTAGILSRFFHQCSNISKVENIGVHLLTLVCGFF